ncbi:MAG: hypothetical protein R2911_02985 [Caldilineaceae bacterium]
MARSTLRAKAWPPQCVPVNEETLLSDGDSVLEAAIAYLDGDLHETAAPAPAAETTQNPQPDAAGFRRRPPIPTQWLRQPR